MKKVIEFLRRATRDFSILGVLIIAEVPLVAHADTLQFFWDGPTSFTFDIPSQLIISVPTGGYYPAGEVPCLFSGVATECGVVFADGGPFPFAGLVVNASILGVEQGAVVEGPSLAFVTYSSDLPAAAGILNIPTGNYMLQMNQIFTSVNDVNPGILFVTDLSTPPAVPEPSSLTLLFTGVLSILGTARTRLFGR